LVSGRGIRREEIQLLTFPVSGVERDGGKHIKEGCTSQHRYVRKSTVLIRIKQLRMGILYKMHDE